MISGVFSAIQHNKHQVGVALKIASDQTVPDKCDLWSDHPRPFNGLLNEK